jgi:hypothetical protein
MTDYGHAAALLRRLDNRPGSVENGEAARVRKTIEEADWRCRQCGAVVTALAEDGWKTSPSCEHSFTWDYELVETQDAFLLCPPEQDPKS